MLLSIILPVYRVEAYLTDCLRSILPLCPEQVELLLVDDCGGDGSFALARRLTEGRGNVRLLRHEGNRGLSAARNTGLCAASGEYVLFADTDDLLVTEAVLPLAQRAREQGLDILQAAYQTFSDVPGETAPPPVLAGPTGVLSGDACLAQLIHRGQFAPMVWFRLLRRAFLAEQGLRMPEGLLHEDELFCAPAFLAAGKVQVVSQPLYRYRWRQGSIMHGFGGSSRWCADYLTIAQTLSALCGEPPSTPGKEALRGRAGDIALSIVKNIPAYGLKGPVRAEARAFVRAHRGEIARLAKGGAGAARALQGRLLEWSPGGYEALYRAALRLRR